MDRSFAIYRLPDEEDILLVEQEDCGVTYPLTPPYELAHGFVMAPFHEDDANRSILIRADKLSRVSPADVQHVLKGYLGDAQQTPTRGVPDDTFSETEERQKYFDEFALFYRSLSEGTCRKIVLSHPFQRPLGNVVELFSRLLTSFPHSLVYLACSPATGLWLGASPEVLLKSTATGLSTMSLAGTKTQSADEWDDKNRSEQAYVTHYIREVLSPMVEEVCEQGPFTMKTGHLFHLCTTFDFHLRPSCSLAQLVDALHPTPAVCGVPKREAMRFILQHEHHPRRYYAGFVGPLNIDGRLQLHVNIRCAECHPNGLATCYAGSGLIVTSQVESEWQEVKRKSESLGHEK